MIGRSLVSQYHLYSLSGMVFMKMLKEIIQQLLIFMLTPIMS